MNLSQTMNKSMQGERNYNLDNIGLTILFVSKLLGCFRLLSD